jgi:CheY-like chemotaxis protein
MSGPRKLRLWLIDDSDHDAELMTMALAACDLPPKLEHITAGDQALEILRERSRDARALPDLILLDLRLLDTHGLDVLGEIKSNLRLSRIPVIVMTGSDDDAEIQAAYGQQAALVLKKRSSQAEMRTTFGAMLHLFGTAAPPAVPREALTQSPWTGGESK